MVDVGAQDQLIPMGGNSSRRQRTLPINLRAKLLRQRDARRLRFTVGVIGANAKPQPVMHRHDHRLRLARGVGAENFQLRGLRRFAVLMR